MRGDSDPLMASAIASFFTAADWIWSRRYYRKLRRTIFIDASKSFSNDSVSYKHIELKPLAQKQKEFKLDCILKPESVLTNIFRRAVLDHIHYRIDPKSENVYYHLAKEVCKKVIPDLDVREVSGTKREGEISIFGKTRKGSGLYDVREFSAGEKALFLTLMFVFYVPSIGVIVFDEPENHFHEDMLNDFFNLLASIAEAKSIESWISKQGIELTDGRLNLIPKTYKWHTLEQIFFLTHSKSLIYRNFSVGINYLADGEFKEISRSDVEANLRSMGLSTVYSKVVFVEGSDDQTFMTEALSSDNIQVKALNSCEEVIGTFGKLSKITEHLHNVAFCFVVDNDNKTEWHFESLRDKNPEFYDRTFVVLNEHEFENYLLDENLFYDVIAAIEKNVGKETSETPESVLGYFKEASLELRGLSMKKSIKFAFERIIFGEISTKLTNSKERIEDESYVNECLDSALSIETRGAFMSALGEVKSDYDAEKWGSEWKRLVDGKVMLNKTIANYAKILNVKNEYFRDSIIYAAKKKPEKYAAGRIVSDIIQRIKAQ